MRPVMTAANKLYHQAVTCHAAVVAASRPAINGCMMHAIDGNSNHTASKSHGLMQQHQHSAAAIDMHATCYSLTCACMHGIQCISPKTHQLLSMCLPGDDAKVGLQGQ